jgi:uncharacterized protein (DUF1697 family)
MKTYIALLRGINVSGHRMIKMDELKKILGELNYTNIRTYIQSGNIIFESENKEPASLEKQIEEKILNHFDFQVPVAIRTRSELDNIYNNNPFLGKRSEPTDKLHVTFFPEQPDKEQLNKIEGLLFLPDEFIASGREVYLLCPNGYGQTKLTNQFFENKLKLTATTRNWKTIETLLQMSHG